MNPLSRRVAIACGGTGGHLFPGIAVGDALVARGCEVTLLVSPKEVDQTAVKSAYGMDVESLSMIGLAGNPLKFGCKFIRSTNSCRKLFFKKPPAAVLAMGGFTSLPPVIVGKIMGAKIFLHEANAVPGRAVRMLSSFADEVFVQFPDSLSRVLGGNVRATGLPVRATMEPVPKADARTVLGLADDLPVLLIMGGSQGAEAINRAVLGSLPYLAKLLPKIQFIHLTGNRNSDPIRSAYDTLGLRAVVRPFLTEMEYALGAADLVISRAGASSLAEFSSMELPAILVPYPSAVDDHQRLNARTFVEMGAARCFHQKQLTPSLLTQQLKELLGRPVKLKKMGEAMKQWKSDCATEEVVKRIYEVCGWESSEEDDLIISKSGLTELAV
ncbi:MAG: undecaprenyldiphospho-muramoylpentapeptide beta-N-acetylglucosaminyltransferase [Verrucomicrobiales bacterium]|nr:undecaprenyldiphospho-muramoylpentapeptide beta-N-acetylglucosaminyltransferase [Verrucomicrobiales bacterium]